MDNEKDMEEHHGQQVFVSQLLDWDSLTHQLFVPEEKAPTFKAHYYYSQWRKNKMADKGGSHFIIILFEKGGYKATAQEVDSSFDQAKTIAIRYSYELANALKDKFGELYEWLSVHKDETDAICPLKIRIFLVASYSPDVYKLNYTIESTSSFKESSSDVKNEGILDDEEASELSPVQRPSELKPLILNEDLTDDFANGTINHSKPLVHLDSETQKTSLDQIPSPQTELMSFTLADDIPSLAYTRPVDFSYIGQLFVHKVRNWTDFIVQVGKLVFNGIYGSYLKDATDEDYDFSTRHCIGESSDGMLDPKQIGPDLWIETNLSATQLAQFAKWMVSWCKLEPKDFVVHYEKKEHAVIRGTGSYAQMHDLTTFPNASENIDESVEVDPFQAIDKPSQYEANVESFTLKDEIPDLYQTQPVDFIYEKQRHEVLSWADLAVQIAKVVYAEPFGNRLKKASSRDYIFSDRECISKRHKGMLNPRQIEKDLWIETALNATQLAKFAQWMVKWCFLPSKTFVIHYQKINIAEKDVEKVEHADEIHKPLTSVEADLQFTLADLKPKAAHHLTPDAIAYKDKTYPVSNWEEFVKQMALIAFSSEYGYRLRKSANFEFSKQFSQDDVSEQLDIGKIDTAYDFDKAFSLPSAIHFVKLIMDKCRINPRDIVIYYHINTKDTVSQAVHSLKHSDITTEEDIEENSKKDVSHDASSIAHELNRPLGVSSEQSSKDTEQELEKASFTLADDIPQLTFTRPLDFIFNGKMTIVRSWAKLMVQFVTSVVEFHKRHSLDDIQPDDFNLAGLPFISKLPLKMRIPKRIGDDLWIETNVNAQQLVGCLKRVALYCRLDLNDIVIHYERKHIPSSEKTYPVSIASTQTSTCQQSENALHDLQPSRRIIFSKRLNWSMMTLGMTIPTDMTNAFLANLSYQPIKGRMYPITLMFDGQKYSAQMTDVKYSDVNRTRTVQIRYTASSAIALAFQNKFQTAYRQFQNDHRNSEGINAFITLVTTDRLDYFELVVSDNQITTSQISTRLTITQESPSASECYSNNSYQSILQQETVALRQDFIDECRQVLEFAFPRGFKQGSVIDKNKFSRKYEELIGKPLSDEDSEHVWEACTSVGIVLEDKVFPLTDVAKETIKRHADEWIEDGVRQVYFTSLFDRYQDDFCDNGIGSSDILVAILLKLYPDYTHTDQFMQINSTVSSEDEILRVLRECGSLTLDGLQEKLPAMPKDSILQTCKASTNIIKDGERYILLENIKFDEEEIIQARQLIESSIEDKGYLMLREINLENSLLLNDDISFETLAKVAFSKYFADDFSLTNSLISQKDESLSVSKMVKVFCEEHKQFTLKEIENFANQLNGYGSAHSLGIAQSNAIQVDDEHFVHPSLVDFDVDAIDQAIGKAMPDKMQAIQAFHSFFDFPAVPGYSWTLKLLASYCRLASHEFSLLEHAPNNVSIGIIIHKNVRCNGYYQAVAMMALKDGIPMDYDSIGNFAIRKGFLNRKRPSALSSILSEMKQLSGEA